MTDEQALMKAVLENPADDVCRLVYADWLQERGRNDRAALIRNQIERAAGGAVECPECNGTGCYLGAGPDRGNPTCDRCKGLKVVPDTLAARMRYVSESLARDEAILKRWGLKWLPKFARGRRCQLWQVVGETVQVIDSNGRTDLYTFERGFLTFATVNLNVYPTTRGQDVGRLARSILAAHPVWVLSFDVGSHGLLNLTTGTDAAGRWITLLHPLNRESGAAALSWPTRLDVLRNVAGFVEEFWPDVVTADPDPYTREYYEQGALGEPLPPPMDDDEFDRMTDALNNVDMPHER